MVGFEGGVQRKAIEKGVGPSQQSSKQRRKNKRQRSELVTARVTPSALSVHNDSDAKVSVSGVRMVKVVEHVAARLEEVKLMERRLLEHQPPPGGKMVILPNRGMPDDGMRLHGGKRAFQKLPKHMRRRAASHNVNRVPASVRKQALREREKAEETRKNGEKKKQNKKNTKKPKSKDLELRRIRSGALWLETHVWARKRMHLELSWGWQLPIRASEKGKRAAYKNFRNVCTAYDMSYYRVIEVTAPTDILKAILSLVTDSTIRPLPHSNYFVNGGREAVFELYRCGGVSCGLVAPVKCLWENASHLLMWIHPSAAEEALEELNKALEETLASMVRTDFDTDVPMNGQMASSVSVVTLLPPGELLRFRLIGPRANALLHAVLKVSESTEKETRDVWEKLEFARSCGELGSGVSLALHAFDPRHSFPPPPTKLYLSNLEKRRPPGSAVGVCSLLAEWPKGLGSSPLLNSDTRSWPVPTQQEAIQRAGRALEKKLKRSDGEDEEMAEAKREKGEERLMYVEMERDGKEGREKKSEAAEFPLLLIQQESERRERGRGGAGGGAGESLGSGWDVVIPKGWAMPLWVSLIHAGCRAVGLRDMRKLSHEMGTPCFPYDYPDCDAYVKWSAGKAKELEEVYERKPPGKRVNYPKLSITHPFSSPWQTLIELWCTSRKVKSVSVLRGRALALFEESLWQVKALEDDNVISCALLEKRWSVPEDLSPYSAHLVMVRVELEAMGTVDRFSLLSLPRRDHLQSLRSFRGGHSSGRALTSMAEAGKPRTGHSSSGLWSLASSEEPTPVIGFVTSAGHSYALGKGTAIAFCPVAALVAIASTQASPRTRTLTALLRATTHRDHRFARISIAR